MKALLMCVAFAALMLNVSAYYEGTIGDVCHFNDSFCCSGCCMPYVPELFPGDPDGFSACDYPWECWYVRDVDQSTKKDPSELGLA